MSARRRRRATRPFQLVWTDRALSDLEAVGDYIARDDPKAGERWVTRLMATAESAARHPMACRRAPELARDDVREALLGTYRIVFRIAGARVEVLTVFEGHRRFPADVEP